MYAYMYVLAINLTYSVYSCVLYAPHIQVHSYTCICGNYMELSSSYGVSIIAMHALAILTECK